MYHHVSLDEPSEFCSDALQQKTILLPDECMQPGSNTSAFEVGECLAKKCRADITTDSGTCGEEIDTCCSVEEYQVESINCTNYELDIFVVKSCSCASCTPLEVKISGVATGLENGTPVKFATVYLNGDIKVRTTIVGSFEFMVNSTRSRWTITIEDDIYKLFLPASKVVEIFDDFNGLIIVEIKMIKASDPVEIDSAIDNMLMAGSSGSNVSNVLFEIPAHAFCYRNGSKYTGTVEARLTYLDPLNTSIIEHIPGSFQYVDDEGLTGDLISMGVFNLYFEDTSGQPIVLNQVVDAYIPVENGEKGTYEDFKLWTLNSQTGVWEHEGEYTDRRRKRRQTDNVWVGALADVSEQKWYNYDKVNRLSDNLCYFKIRLFKDKKQAVPIDYPSNGITVSTNIIRGRTLHTIAHYVYSPTSKCLNAPCDHENGFITGKTSIQLLSAGKPHPSTGIKYSISSDETVLTVQLISSVDGPFHSTKDLCASAPVDKSYLSFSYGITNYEWKFIDFPRQCDDKISKMNPLIRQRFWYPRSLHFNDKYSACFVNIKIQFRSGKDIHKGEMKLRAFSYGGYGSKIYGKILGIHESDVQGSQTYCLEYRCSGYIDTCNYSVCDKTIVRIILEYPKNILRCYVDESANGLENAYTYNHQNSDYTYFQFSAPHEEFGTNAGIHFETKVPAGNLENVKDDLKDECLDNSHYAVKFYCE
ncbi:cartilage intermediate layer protein 1-like [Mercenaria mercenaria]|uniref:cartilage intermediate layer protein 1-like n=1 Tax=Mercenaria mercenaria TaxID=6596 RepID=UPI00234EA67B|nr:cartilage intermediate layer protein 1-like [Mercenaria mercenaria]